MVRAHHVMSWLVVTLGSRPATMGRQGGSWQAWLHPCTCCVGMATGLPHAPSPALPCLPCPDRVRATLPPLPGQSAGCPAPPAWPECGLPCLPCLAVRAALPPLPGQSAGCPASPAWPECGLPCLPCPARVRATLPPLPGQSAGCPASPAWPECRLPAHRCPLRQPFVSPSHAAASSALSPHSPHSHHCGAQHPPRCPVLGALAPGWALQGPPRPLRHQQQPLPGPGWPLRCDSGASRPPP